MIGFHDFGDHWFGPGFGAPEFFLALLFSVLKIAFWIAVVVIVVRLVRRNGVASRAPSALHVLEERYARGEISREDFNERRAVLLGTDPPPSAPPPEGPLG